MNKTLTLVATGATNSDALKRALAEQLTILDIKTREAHVFDILCVPDTTLSPALRDTLYALNCDFALQDAERLPKKVFISDMDATMVVGETIDEMAETLGIGDKISAITARAMRGELGFEDALRERLGLMQGIAKSTVLEMADSVTLTEGADKLLAEINRRGIDSFLISGGFTEFTQQVSAKLGFNNHKANQLGYDDNDALNGTWTGELVNANVKVATLKKLAQSHGVSLAQTIAIGDGANDSQMIAAAGLGVSYYGKPILREAANAEIHSGTIANLIYFL